MAKFASIGIKEMSTIQGFSHQLIDYAGLFPPAGLDMPTVVRNYSEYVRSPKCHMLARLIIPAARLGEFEESATEFLPTADQEKPWRISALLPPHEEGQSDFQLAVQQITQFNKLHSNPVNGLAIVDVIEINTPSIGHIRRTMRDLPEEFRGFLEIPHREDPTEMIASVATANFDNRFFAKIRTGGVTADLIPTCAEVARFLRACAEHLVGFKATAGLHHPIRNEFDLTYKPDSPRGTMHGFVNVFVAACLAFGRSISVEQIKDILESDSAELFVFSDDRLRWGDFELSSTKVASLRRTYAISFGSCSFTEPTEEFEQAGFVGLTADATI